MPPDPLPLAQVIVIDEVSMLTAGALHGVNHALNHVMSFSHNIGRVNAPLREQVGPRCRRPLPATGRREAPLQGAGAWLPVSSAPSPYCAIDL
eukprot:scaffold133368_cov103-Phaeocystis_antarctica.AAC.2